MQQIKIPAKYRPIRLEVLDRIKALKQEVEDMEQIIIQDKLSENVDDKDIAILNDKIKELEKKIVEIIE